MKLRSWTILLCLGFLFLSQASSSDFHPITVILIRHAEKSTEPAQDPVLSEKGEERARALVRLLGSTAINAIYTSQYARTRLTGQPLAEFLGIPITEYDAAKTDALVESLSKRPGETALVVGHSNTIPEIIQALGGDAIPEIADTEYDNLYIVTVFGPGKTTVLRLKY